eukprot:Rmarinus@m.14837
MSLFRLLAALLALEIFVLAATLDCGSISDEATCADGCVWCDCKAINGGCFTPEEAKLLPPGIFRCPHHSEDQQRMSELVRNTKNAGRLKHALAKRSKVTGGLHEMCHHYDIEHCSTPCTWCSSGSQSGCYHQNDAASLSAEFLCGSNARASDKKSSASHPEALSKPGKNHRSKHPAVSSSSPDPGPGPHALKKLNEACKAITDAELCLDECMWCQSPAHSGCFHKKTARNLPSRVYQCGDAVKANSGVKRLPNVGQEFPQFQGTPAEHVASVLRILYPSLEVFEQPANLPVSLTADVRHDRIRLFVDENGLVAETPKVG